MASTRVRTSSCARTPAGAEAGPRTPASLDPVLFGVIDAVEEREGGVTVTSVSDRLGVDQPRASRLVARAVDAGLVRGVADPADGRRSTLELTALGTEHAERVHRLRREVFGTAMRGRPERDRREFARLLTAFVAELGARHREAGYG
ncbi:MarR family winged helix-turn-helix transcriptional regulator [Streptosporangium sp. NPDC023615]|uniref:MarR family winged helix-turn-helix transcriptional regulator n=1 Tax=Streptosporangium sp. NPDC023615 TaxID=3154794 RepID=UPI003449C9C0